jgi:hypothetical protein
MMPRHRHATEGITDVKSKPDPDLGASGATAITLVMHYTHHRAVAFWFAILTVALPRVFNWLSRRPNRSGTWKPQQTT